MRHLFLLVTLTFLLPTAAVQSSSAATCGAYSAEFFELGIRDDGGIGNGYVRVYDVATGAVLDERPTASASQQPTASTGCVWVAHVGEPTSGPNRVGLPGQTLMRVDIWRNLPTSALPGPTTAPDHSFYYSLYNSASTDTFTRFDNSGPGSGFPDLLVLVEPAGGIRYYPTEIGAGASGRDVDDFFADDHWVLPYDLPAICASTGCDPSDWNDLMFLTPTTPTAAAPSLPLDLTLTAGADWLVPADRDMTWSASEVAALRYGDGGLVTVEGALAVDGVTLTAEDAADGWHGVRAEGPAADLTLRDATVEGVRFVPCAGICPALLYPPHASVEALGGAQVLLSGTSVVQNGVYANGVLASGVGAAGPKLQPSELIIRDASSVTGNDGYGAVASAGARVSSTDPGATISENEYGGVRSTGSGSRMDIWGNSNVLENLGYGVTAAANGQATVASPATVGGAPNTQNSLVELNEGGLRSVSGGFVWTGAANALGTCRGVHPSAVNFNNLSGEDDARATSGSVVTARCTYWDGRTLPSQLDTYADGSSSVAVTPLKATPTAFAPGGTSSAKTGDSGGSAARGGDDALGAAEAVRALAYTGDPEGAGTLLTASLLMATNDDARLALYSAAADLAAGGLPGVLYAALEADGSAWARRALAVDAAHAGDRSGAAAHAEALTDASGHEAFGHGLLVRLAADAGDPAGALAALAAFSGAAGEDDADALGAALALVAVTFPELDLSELSAGEQTPFAAAKGEAAQAATFAAYPNPSAGRATVALRVDEPSTASVTLYDALGRRVATLHEGALSEGDHAFSVDGADLAPGLYVVTARLTDASGAVRTEAARWTRTR